MLKAIGFGLVAIDCIMKKEHPLVIIGFSSFFAYHVYSGLPDSVKSNITAQFAPEFSGLNKLADLKNTVLGKPIKKSTAKVSNINDRIKHIRKLIHKGKEDATIRGIAADLVRDLPERDYKGEIKTLASYVSSNVRFTKDIEGADTYFHPVRILESGVGDCDDFSILLGALFGSIGHPVKLKVVQTKGYSEYNHIYPMVTTSDNGDDWIAVDLSTGRRAGWEVPQSEVIKEKVFDV